MKNILILSIIFSFTNAISAEVGGIKFKDSLQINGKNLTLNGVGKRVVAFFIKPHLSALYLESKSTDASKILSSGQAKYIIMHLKMDLSQKKLRKAIMGGIKTNKVDQVKYKKEIDQLLSVLEDSKEGERLKIFMNDKFVSVQKGAKKIMINSGTFGNQLLKLWIGTPPNKALKKGMLGL